MKRLWISVKRGFIRDPKHRKAVGECVWLFEYLLDIADWDTGIVSDWKDEAGAEEMALPVRTLRDQRRKLEELGYIACRQRQHSQDLVILNWTNPREYTGEVLNRKPQGYTQGYTEGDTQGSTQPAVPTSTPNTKHQKKGDIVDGMVEAARQAKERGEVEVEETLCRLDIAFKATFPRSARSQAIARWIMAREKEGQALDAFVQWAKRDEFNLSRTYEYAETPEKIRTRWPQAFTARTTQPKNPGGSFYG